MDENKNMNISPEEPEIDQQAQPAEPVEAPVDQLWNAPEAEQPVERPAEQPQGLTASNTSVGNTVAQPVYVDPSAMFNNNTTDHSYAVISLVLGIIGLVMCCSGASIAFGVIGLILGIICRKHGNREGVSLAGIVTSSIALGLGLVSILISSFFWVAVFEEMLYENPDLFGTLPDDYIKMFRPF